MIMVIHMGQFGVLLLLLLLGATRPAQTVFLLSLVGQSPRIGLLFKRATTRDDEKADE